MKRCPQCNRVETDDALAYCRVDGALLIDKTSLTDDSSATRLLPGSRTGETDGVQKEQPQVTTSSLNPAPKSEAQARKLQETGSPSKVDLLSGGVKQNKTLVVLLIVAAILIGGGLVTAGSFGIWKWYVARRSSVLSNRPPSGLNIKLQRLTTSGRASDAVIVSPASDQIARTWS